MNRALGSKTTTVVLDAPATIGAIIFLAVLAPAMFILQPGYVQGLVGYVGLTEQQAGQVASAEMFGLATMAVVVMFVIERFNWRAMTLVFIGLFLAGNLASLGQDSFTALRVIRFCAGLGSGGLMSITFTMMGLTRRTDRNMGLIISAVLSYGAIGLLVMPKVFQTVGVDGFIGFLAAFSFAGIFAVPRLPCFAQTHPEKPAVAAILPTSGRLTLLAGVLIYNVAIGIVWVYIFLVGIDAGIAEQKVANALTASQFMGIAGAFVPVLLETRAGRRAPLLLGILGGALGIAMLLEQPGLIFYATGVCLFNFLWNLTLPYIIATLASFDATGKLVAQGICMQAIGFALGPMIAASLLGAGGYDGVNQTAIALFAGAALLMFWVLRRTPIGAAKDTAYS